MSWAALKNTRIFGREFGLQTGSFFVQALKLFFGIDPSRIHRLPFLTLTSLLHKHRLFFSLLITMSAAASTTIPSASQTEVTSKRNSAFQAGLEKMRDTDILKTSGQSLTKLAKLAANNAEHNFDLLYVNMPWKSVSMDYAKSLPVADLVKGKDHAGLLLWVDGPCVDKATKLIDAWGFRFHSVLHVTSYANPSPSEKTAISSTSGDDAAATNKTTETATEDNAPNDAMDTGNAAGTPEETVASSKAAAPSAFRKTVPPHGWVVDGIVPSRSRQLWFAVRGDSADTPYLKDASFIRKRLQATSTFEYSKEEAASTALSSKKKNLDNWVVFPEYDAYVPADVEGALATIHKANARVLSLFSDSLHRNWYTWGPNVPGYVNCPMRPDGGFPIVNALLKYFSAMKGATVQKYLTLMNLYAVQSAKQLGSTETGNVELDEEGNPKQHLTPLVTGRMQDFCEDLIRRYQEGGGIKESELATAGYVSLTKLGKFGDLDPKEQTQVLLLVAQVIRGVMHKHAEATERRKRAIKRKREMNNEEGDAVEGEPKPRVPRKFGIAAPVDISEDLCKFLGLAPGEKVARTTVVKHINEYISKNNLQNPQRRSEIVCDDALKKLLNPGPNFVVNYFNLCKLLGPHFISTKKSEAGLGSGTGGKPLPAELSRPAGKAPATQTVV